MEVKLPLQHTKSKRIIMHGKHSNNLFTALKASRAQLIKEVLRAHEKPSMLNIYAAFPTECEESKVKMFINRNSASNSRYFVGTRRLDILSMHNFIEPFLLDAQN